MNQLIIDFCLKKFLRVDWVLGRDQPRVSGSRRPSSFYRPHSTLDCKKSVRLVATTTVSILTGFPFICIERKQKKRNGNHKLQRCRHRIWYANFIITISQFTHLLRSLSNSRCFFLLQVSVLAAVSVLDGVSEVRFNLLYASISFLNSFSPQFYI